MNEKVYGLIAEFDSPAAILHAAEKVRDAGYRRWDTFTPFPIHGMEKVMKLGNSLVGWVSLAMGAGAFLSVVGLIRSEEHTSDSSHLVISYAVFCLKRQ